MNVIFNSKRSENDLNKIDIGEKLEIKLNGSNAIRTATLVCRAFENAYFIFDECVSTRPLSKDYEDGYCMSIEDTELPMWLRYSFQSRLPKPIREMVVEIMIPSYEMIFLPDESVHDKWYTEYVIKYGYTPVVQKFANYMKSMKNRMACYNDDISEYWLSNRVFPKNYVGIHSCFSTVSIDGKPNFSFSTKRKGVRPILVLNDNTTIGKETKIEL